MTITYWTNFSKRINSTKQPTGGTNITVDFALEQGKNIYAIPGNIDNPNAYGTNCLIKEGATVVTSIQDILEEL